jgi:hypothetical protein
LHKKLVLLLQAHPLRLLLLVLLRLLDRIQSVQKLPLPLLLHPALPPLQLLLHMLILLVPGM